jgi:hypothetical protein
MNRIGRFVVIMASISALIFLALTGYAQKLKPADVPENIKQTLWEERGEVKVRQWIFDNDMYVATFKFDGSTVQCYINSDGEFVRASTIIPKNTLPTSIMEYIKNNYPEFAIPVSEIREEPNTPMYYHVEVKPEVLGAKHSILTFDIQGELISRVDPEGFTTPELTPQQLVQKKADEKLAESNRGKSGKKQRPQPQKKEPAAKEPKQQAKPKQEAETSQFADIPAAVQKSLTKKVIRPEGLQWNREGDYYVAECTVSKQKNQLFFTPEGNWEKTLVYISKENVTGPMLKHLNTYFKGFKFTQGIREQRADKQDKVLVEFIEKGNSKSQTTTTVVFDKLGRVIKTYYPSGDHPSDPITKLEPDYLYKLPEDIPTTAIEAFQAKYPKVTGVEWSEDDEGYFLASYYGMRGKEVVVMEGNGTFIEIRTAANMQNINGNIKGYIKKNHKGYTITEYYTVRGLIEKKNSFYVVIQDKKTNITIPLSFTTAGQIMQ